MKARRYVVRGRVQGVGFRYHVELQARALGLSGWVRNVSDGSVETVMCGSDAQLEAIERELRQGPPLARVTEVVTSETSAPLEEGFHIRRTAR